MHKRRGEMSTKWMVLAFATENCVLLILGQNYYGYLIKIMNFKGISASACYDYKVRTLFLLYT